MPDAGKRIDAYIAKAPAFAQPICRALRKAVLGAADGIVEDWKWSCPSFNTGGLICLMGAFKAHVRFVFFKGPLLEDPRKLLRKGLLLFRAGDRIDAKAVAGFVRQSIALNEKGVKVTRAPRAELPVPKDLKAALAKDRKADSFFASLSPSCRREYVEWIVEAKRPETRLQRIGTTVVQCRQGKTRHWKYR
jgi:uncharacterized protein YdeI (YjbR/CyaY-like superfamily)